METRAAAPVRGGTRVRGMRLTSEEATAIIEAAQQASAALGGGSGGIYAGLAVLLADAAVPGDGSGGADGRGRAVQLLRTRVELLMSRTGATPLLLQQVAAGQTPATTVPAVEAMWWQLKRTSRGRSRAHLPLRGAVALSEPHAEALVVEVETVAVEDETGVAWETLEVVETVAVGGATASPKRGLHQQEPELEPERSALRPRLHGAQASNLSWRTPMDQDLMVAGLAAAAQTGIITAMDELPKAEPPKVARPRAWSGIRINRANEGKQAALTTEQARQLIMKVSAMRKSAVPLDETFLGWRLMWKLRASTDAQHGAGDMTMYAPGLSRKLKSVLAMKRYLGLL